MESQRNLIGQEYELSAEMGKNSARCVHSDPSQGPCISGSKDVPFLQVQGGHLSHEGFYHLHQGRPGYLILGQYALNPGTCNLTKHVTLGKISPGIIAIKSSVIRPQRVKQEYFPGV